MKAQNNIGSRITQQLASMPRNGFTRLAGVAAGLVLAGTFAIGADWPQWRGPLRNDISTETGLLKQWPAGGPPLAWKATGCGVGYSSVAVARGRIFTMGDSAGTSHVRAFDERTGQPLWTSPPLGKAAGDPPGTRSTPTVDGDLVYALGQLGDWVCLEAATGKERWRKSLKDLGGSAPGWLYAESPLVDGDKVVCTPGGPRGAIVALDKKTGELIWQSK
jgi:outer membrane protein assembly factor BamB